MNAMVGSEATLTHFEAVSPLRRALGAPRRVTPGRRRRPFVSVHAAGPVGAAAVLALAPTSLRATDALLLFLGLTAAWSSLLARAVRDRPLTGTRLGPRAVALLAVQLVVLGSASLWWLMPDLPGWLLIAMVIAMATSVAVVDLLRARASGTSPTRMLVAAPPTDAAGLIEELMCTPGVDVVGRCSPGALEVLSTARTLGADVVTVLPSPELDATALRRLGWQLAEEGKGLMVATGLLGVEARRTRVAVVGDSCLLRVRPSELRSLRRTAQHFAGRCLAAVILVVLSPALAALAVAVRLGSPGPALFRQRRVGKDGREFTMLKLRTMTDDAPERRADLAPDHADGVLFKMRQDPRVTPIGAVLRRYSLDELPQLINVVRGEMALVGPRPALPEEVAQYSPYARRRLAVRPGLTGLWQVSGRSDLSWDESVRLDLRYVDNWSPSSDLGILARTAGAVLTHRGAY